MLHPTIHASFLPLPTSGAATARWIGTLVAILCTGTVSAQPSSTPRVFFNVNAGSQVTSTTFVDNVAFTEFLEEADFDATYGIASNMSFDIGGGIRTTSNLGVGISVSRFKILEAATIDGRIPHPFYFARKRTIEGRSENLFRDEISTHLDVQWFRPVSDSLEFSVFGGPTFFSVTQGLVTAISFDHAYPFDTATFSSASTGEQAKSTIGVNLGADMGYFFSDAIGIGALVRFSRGSVNLSSADGGEILISLGGLHVGGGLRIRF